MSTTAADAIDAPACGATKRSLSLSRTWGYGLGDFGINLYFISAMTYLMFFYTDVFGISAAAVATLFSWLAASMPFTDPLMG